MPLLDQNYGGANALQITAVANPQTYTLYLFNNADWTAGRNDTGYAVAFTGLNASGNWLTPLQVVGGVYTLVAESSDSLAVCFPHLTVADDVGSGGSGGSGGSAITLQVNGTTVTGNPVNLVQGSNLQIVSDGTGRITFSSSVNPVWG